MVIIIPNDRCIVDLLQEAALKVDEILSFHLHDVGKTVNQALNLLIVVQLVGYHCSNAEHPCTLFIFYLSASVYAVAREDAQREGDEEGLRRVVDELNGLQVELEVRDFDGPDGADEVLGDELITEHLLT